jgi:hypothetical protein
MKYATWLYRACLLVLGTTGNAPAEADTIGEVRALDRIVVDAKCSGDFEDWSLLERFELVSSPSRWVLRSTLESVLLRFNAAPQKASGKRSEPNIALKLAIVVRSPGAGDEIPPDVNVVVLDRSYREPEIVAGTCADADSDDVVRAATECDPVTYDAFLGVWRRHGLNHHPDLHWRFSGDWQVDLRACVEEQPAGDSTGAGLSALVGPGVAFVEQL